MLHVVKKLACVGAFPYPGVADLQDVDPCTRPSRHTPTPGNASAVDDRWYCVGVVAFGTRLLLYP